MRGVGRIRQQENKPALGYISSPVYVKAARTATRGLIKGRGNAGKRRGTGGRETEMDDERSDAMRKRDARTGMQIAESMGFERKGEKRGTDGEGGLQESKLGDFEFQSIKLLAFRRAVVVAATATAVVVRFSSSPLSLYLSLSLSSRSFSSRTLSSFSPSPPSSRPLFSPYPLCLPPRTVALRLKYIPMYLQPPRVPHTRRSPASSPGVLLSLSLSPLSSHPSTAAPPPLPTNLHVYTHACGRALSAVARVHTPSTVRRAAPRRAVTPPPSIADRPSGQMVEKERSGQTLQRKRRRREREDEEG